MGSGSQLSCRTTKVLVVIHPQSICNMAEWNFSVRKSAHILTIRISHLVRWSSCELLNSKGKAMNNILNTQMYQKQRLRGCAL